LGSLKAAVKVDGDSMETFFEGLVALAVTIAIVVALFILCRKFVLWYWKLDKIEEHLKAIRESLEKKA
jgi:hypothetical protein